MLCLATSAMRDVVVETNLLFGFGAACYDARMMFVVVNEQRKYVVYHAARPCLHTQQLHTTAPRQDSWCPGPMGISCIQLPIPHHGPAPRCCLCHDPCCRQRPIQAAGKQLGCVPLTRSNHSGTQAMPRMLRHRHPRLQHVPRSWQGTGCII